MPSVFIKRTCLNPNCNKNYDLTKIEAKSDDGYCCFECWEEMNCEAPQEEVDIFETNEVLDLKFD